NYFFRKKKYYEALRLKCNYNPNLMAKFWKNSFSQLQLSNNEALKNRIYVARYEEVIEQPQKIVEELDNFLEADIPVNVDLSFIRSGNTKKWQKGYSKSELYTIESVVCKDMKLMGYNRSQFSLANKFMGSLLTAL